MEIMQVNFEISHQNTPQFNVKENSPKERRMCDNPQDTDARLVKAERYDASPTSLEIHKVCFKNFNLFTGRKEVKNRC